MTYKTEYVLPMFSSNLEKEPEIQITGLEVAIRISGYDDEEQFSEVLLKFQSVLEFTRTSSKFGITEGSYDTVIKIENSKRLAELKETNERDYAFWSPNQYAFYLDGSGFFQIIADSFEVERLV